MFVSSKTISKALKKQSKKRKKKKFVLFFGIFKDRTMKNIMRKVGFLFNLFVKYDTFILSNLFYLKSSIFFLLFSYSHDISYLLLLQLLHRRLITLMAGVIIL